MRVPSLGREDPPKEELATHSSNLAWKIPWAEKAGGLQSMGSQRIRHDRVTEPKLAQSSWGVGRTYVLDLAVLSLLFSYYGRCRTTLFLNWNIIALSCCVNSCCTVKWIAICIHIPPPLLRLGPPFPPSHPSKSSQTTELSSLYWKVLPTSYLFYTW